MSLLKRIPLRYKGELHDVRLINFSVDMDEVAPKVPSPIKVRTVDGRAMISMVDVKLRAMRATTFPLLRFGYRHVAFRLLVDDTAYTNSTPKGIFFLRSFTDKPLIVFGGKILTDYNLETASIAEQEGEVIISKGGEMIRYSIGRTPIEGDAELHQRIGALDRAYSLLGNSVRVTQIQREKWPIRQVSCTWENNFFQSARLEGAFRVFETIYYDWLPPVAVSMQQGD